MRARNRRPIDVSDIVDAFDDLPDAAFFGVMDELGVDLSADVDDDSEPQHRDRKKRGAERRAR